MFVQIAAKLPPVNQYINTRPQYPGVGSIPGSSRLWRREGGIENPAAVRTICPLLKLQPINIYVIVPNPPAGERRRRRRKHKGNLRNGAQRNCVKLTHLLALFFAHRKI
jgi:hypothetical protein